MIRLQQKNKNTQNKLSMKKSNETISMLRLQQELTDLDMPNARIQLIDSQILHRFIVILNIIEETSLWYPASISFTFEIPLNYPYNPPLVKCNNIIYHPNIDYNGNISLNVLRSDWNPCLGLNIILFGLNHIFIEPNYEDFINSEASCDARENFIHFSYNVKQSLIGSNIKSINFSRLV